MNSIQKKLDRNRERKFLIKDLKRTHGGPADRVKYYAECLEEFCDEDDWWFYYWSARKMLRQLAMDLIADKNCEDYESVLNDVTDDMTGPRTRDEYDPMIDD